MGAIWFSLHAQTCGGVAGSSLHVSRQSLKTAFATETAFFVAAEGTRWVELIEGVGPDHSGLELVGDAENLAPFVGPDSGAQSITGVVRERDGFRGGAECHDAQDRPEDFFASDAVA